MLIFLLLFRRSYIIQTWGEKALLDQFGFLEGSRFEFNFTNVKGKFLFASLCNYHEYRKLSREKHICSIPTQEYPRLSSFNTVNNEKATYSGKISERNIMYHILSV